MVAGFLGSRGMESGNGCGCIGGLSTFARCLWSWAFILRVLPRLTAPGAGKQSRGLQVVTLIQTINNRSKVTTPLYPLSKALPAGSCTSPTCAPRAVKAWCRQHFANLIPAPPPFYFVRIINSVSILLSREFVPHILKNKQFKKKPKRFVVAPSACNAAFWENDSSRAAIVEQCRSLEGACNGAFESILWLFFGSKMAVKKRGALSNKQNPTQ